MTILKHELNQSKISLIIWTSVLSFMLCVCVLIFPEMKAQMQDFDDMFSSMGSFSDAFGMDTLNFSTMIGYYAIECGNTLGLGGAFFAALCAAGILSKEEREKTAEFLFTHPVSRVRIITEKLISVICQLVVLNLTVYLTSLASIAIVGEEIAWKEMALLHIAHFLLQVEIAAISFLFSALLRRGSAGIGIGVAALMYVLNLIANITDVLEFLKYITPFGFCEGSDIVADASLNGIMVVIGMTVTAGAIVLAYLSYVKKDLR